MSYVKSDLTTGSEGQNTGIDRRGVLAASGALAAMAVGSGAALAASHQHGGMHGSGPYAGVVMAALHCTDTGMACVAHCLELFKAGDTSVADCAASTEEMMAVCTAMHRVARLGSRHAKALAAVCATTCLACEKECRKHAAKHQACKDCADSCVECAKACQAIAA